MIPGFEYTDHEYGHVGVSFADLDAVLADVPIPTTLACPTTASDAILSLSDKVPGRLP